MVISVGILSNDRLRREHEPLEVGTLGGAECARAQTHKHSSGTSKCAILCANTCDMNNSHTIDIILHQHVHISTRFHVISVSRST